MKREILISITGNEDHHYLDKIQEIKQMNFDKVALFLECFESKQRENIYAELKRSRIKEIPLVHLRDDMEKSELDFLSDNYNTTYFTIHEDHFDIPSKWSGFEKKLFLEMTTDDFVSENVKVEKIGGFCVDLAHFQKQKDRKTVDYDYVYERRNNPKLFKCNHLSGYSSEKMTDLHWVNSKNDFDYLKELPKFVFGECMAIEINNSIKEQLKFREHILKFI